MPPQGHMPGDAPTPRRPQRLLLLGFGYVCLALAAIGAVLPVMPTTVFLLGAVWAFGKASPRLQAKLLTHPRFGAGLRAWRDHGAIGRRAKQAALIAMAGSYTVLAATSRSIPVLVIVGGCLAAVALFILTRPSRPPGSGGDAPLDGDMA